MTEIIIPPVYLEAISPVLEASLAYQEQVKKTQVNDEQSYFQAAKIRKEVTTFLSNADKKRLEITKPARDLVEAINEKAKEALKPALEAKETITKFILDYEAILEAQKAKEAQRIAEINKVFLVANTKDTIEANVEMISKVEDYFKKLPESDRALPEVKQACHSLLDRINQKLAILREQEAQRIAKEKLDAAKVAQDQEALELAQKQIELDKAKREQEAEARRLADIQIAQKLEAEKLKAAKATPVAPATGIRERTTFEILDANLVPREYCTPSDPLINAAIKAGITEIAGLRIFKVKG